MELQRKIDIADLAGESVVHMVGALVSITREINQRGIHFHWPVSCGAVADAMGRLAKGLDSTPNPEPKETRTC